MTPCTSEKDLKIRERNSVVMIYTIIELEEERVMCRTFAVDGETNGAY
jgi:hypothetical protein